MAKTDGAAEPIMSVAERKPLLHLARRQAVNCAIAMGKGKQGLILLHRRTKPRRPAGTHAEYDKINPETV